MAKIIYSFTDGSECEVESVDGIISSEMIQSAITEHLEKYPDAGEVTGETFVGDVSTETPNNENIEENKDQDTGASVDGETFTVDENYIYNKIVNSLIVERDEEGNFTDKVKESPLYGMSKGDFETWLERLDFERTLFFIKHKLPNTFVDTTVEEADYEKVANLLGHNGYTVSYSEDRKQWESTNFLRGAVVVVTDANKATCLMRALIIRNTGQFYNNSDIIDLATKYWQKINNSTEVPFDRSREFLDKIAKDAGTSIEEIEEDYKKQVEELEKQTEETK